MKFDIEDFVERPWKYFAIGFALCFIAALSQNPSIAEWNARLLVPTFGMPLAAGVFGYFLLKRRRDGE